MGMESQNAYYCAGFLHQCKRTSQEINLKLAFNKIFVSSPTDPFKQKCSYFLDICSVYLYTHILEDSRLCLETSCILCFALTTTMTTTKYLVTCVGCFHEINFYFRKYYNCFQLYVQEHMSVQ
jgi:hypothetical protein